MKNNPTAPSGHVGSSASFGFFDRDEAFWREIRELPPEVKDRPEMLEMFVFKSKVAQLNRDIEDAIRLRLAGWTASLPNGPLEVDRVFAWQWRRPGPKGGRLFLSTNQAINALRKENPVNLALEMVAESDTRMNGYSATERSGLEAEARAIAKSEPNVEISHTEEKL